MLQQVQCDQKVSVLLTITVHGTGAQRLFDHPVFASESATFMELNRALSIIDVKRCRLWTYRLR